MPPKLFQPTPHLTQDPTAPPRIAMPDAQLEPDVASHPYTLDCSVRDFIMRRLKSCEDDGKWEERARVQVIMDNVLFYRGQHWLYTNPDCRVESMYEDDDDRDDLVIHNWIDLIVEGKAKEWEAARPRLEVSPRATRDWTVEAAARLAQAIDDFLREPMIKAHFRQSEAKFGLMMKVYFRYSFLKRDESDETAARLTIPITEPRQFHLGAGYQCDDCSTQFSEPNHLDGYAPGEDPKSGGGLCPQCESANSTEIEPRLSFTRDVAVDMQEVVIPSLQHLSVNPLCVKLDHRARRIQESGYLIYETLERRYDVEAECEDLNVSCIDMSANLPPRTRAMLELERTSAGVDAFAFGERTHNVGREDDLVRKRRFWMEVRMYGHYRPRADEELCGFQFKAGIPLREQVPQGMLAVVYDENELGQIEAESKNRRWGGAAFKLDPTTFHGKGTEDLHSIQMSIDDKATLAASHFDRAGAPSEIIDTRGVDMDEFDGSTGKRIVLKDTCPENLTVDNVHRVVEAGQLGADFQNFMAQEPVALRELAGTGREMVGQNDPDNKTLGGRQIAAAASSSMLVPSLALRAEEVEPETTFQNLEYAQGFWTDEQFDMFEAEHGADAIKRFRQLNIRRDLKVRAAAGSWIPQTREDELENLEKFTAGFLVPAAQAGLPKSFVRHAASLYNIPPSIFEPERDTKLAQSRLARLRPYADAAFQSGATNLAPEIYEQMLDSIIGQPEFVPSPLMENHPVHMEFYAEQWKQMYDDRDVNPILLDLIDKMHDAHVTAIAQAQFKTQALQMKAQAPQIAAQTVAGEAGQDEQIDGEQERQELAAPKGPPAVSAPQLNAKQ